MTTKLVEEFYFRNGKAAGYCKLCTKESAKESEQRQRDQELGKEVAEENRQVRAKYDHMAKLDKSMYEHKICRSCEEVKPVEEFYPNKEIQDGLDSYCKPCRGRLYKENKSRSPGHRLVTLLAAARTRSRKAQTPFDLTKEYLLRLWEMQEGKCFYTRVSMTYAGDRATTAVSVDRKDPGSGYVKGNIVLCCRRANEVKSDLTIPELLEFCQKVIDVLKEEHCGKA